MRREYSSWISPSLGRRMEFLWFGDRGRPLLIFPTSMGRFYQYEDFGFTGALADKVDAGLLQLICVDSVDEESWYNKRAHPSWRARRHEDYDRYVRWEMLPYIAERARDRNIAVTGASFGAYHAANIAARYPGVVTKAICFSGLYTVHQYVDGYWDDACYFHSPACFIPNMDDDLSQRLRQVEWIVATGELDSLIRENRELADILRNKGVPVRAEFWPGVFGHDWPFWNRYIRDFI